MAFAAAALSATLAGIAKDRKPAAPAPKNKVDKPQPQQREQAGTQVTAATAADSADAPLTSEAVARKKLPLMTRRKAARQAASYQPPAEPVVQLLPGVRLVPVHAATVTLSGTRDARAASLVDAVSAPKLSSWEVKRVLSRYCPCQPAEIVVKKDADSALEAELRFKTQQDVEAASAKLHNMNLVLQGQRVTVSCSPLVPNAHVDRGAYLRAFSMSEADAGSQFLKRKQGCRPDTLVIRDLPTNWFGVSLPALVPGSGPTLAEEIECTTDTPVYKALSQFGPISNISIRHASRPMPRQRSTSDSTVGFDLGAVVLDLNFDVHVQWCHLASLEKAVTDLRGKALVKDGSSLVAMFNFDVDTEGYFSPAVVGKRRAALRARIEAAKREVARKQALQEKQTAELESLRTRFVALQDRLARMVSAPPLSPPAGESTATLAADQKRVDESLRTCATSLRACEMTVPPATVPADSVSAVLPAFRDGVAALQDTLDAAARALMKQRRHCREAQRKATLATLGDRLSKLKLRVDALGAPDGAPDLQSALTSAKHTGTATENVLDDTLGGESPAKLLEGDSDEDMKKDDTPYVMRTVAARMADDVAGATAAVHALQEVDNQAWTKKLAPEDDGFDASDADAALCAAEERLLDERTLLHRHDSLAEIVEGVGEVPAVVVAAIEKLAWARSRVATAALHGAVAECEAAGKAAAEWHRAKSVLAQLQEDLAAVMPHLTVSEDEDSTPAWKADGSRALSAVATKLRGTAEQLATQASASATEADVDALVATVTKDLADQCTELHQRAKLWRKLVDAIESRLGEAEATANALDAVESADAGGAALASAATRVTNAAVSAADRAARAMAQRPVADVEELCSEAKALAREANSVVKSCARLSKLCARAAATTKAAEAASAAADEQLALFAKVTTLMANAQLVPGSFDSARVQRHAHQASRCAREAKEACRAAVVAVAGSGSDGSRASPALPAVDSAAEAVADAEDAVAKSTTSTQQLAVEVAARKAAAIASAKSRISRLEPVASALAEAEADADAISIDGDAQDSTGGNAEKAALPSSKPARSRSRSRSRSHSRSRSTSRSSRSSHSSRSSRSSWSRSRSRSRSRSPSYRASARRRSASRKRDRGRSPSPADDRWQPASAMYWLPDGAARAALAGGRGGPRRNRKRRRTLGSVAVVGGQVVTVAPTAKGRGLLQRKAVVGRGAVPNSSLRAFRDSDGDEDVLTEPVRVVVKRIAAPSPKPAAAAAVAPEDGGDELARLRAMALASMRQRLKASAAAPRTATKKAPLMTRKKRLAMAKAKAKLEAEGASESGGVGSP